MAQDCHWLTWSVISPLFDEGVVFDIIREADNEGTVLDSDTGLAQESLLQTLSEE